MRRGDLAWALTAVLPHAGKTEATAVVGLEQLNGWVHAYATDRYSMGIARIESMTDLDLRFTTKEATDLMRFVRPNRVAEHEQQLVLAVQPGEFHVGLVDADDVLCESEVYETTPHDLELSYLLEFMRRLDAAPGEWGECVFQPPLAAKFAKAQRVDADRLRILPHHASDKYGAAVVTVGTNFIGAIAGLEYDQLGTATVADFLHTEGKAA